MTIPHPKCPFDGHEMVAATKIGIIWMCNECDYHGRPLTVKELRDWGVGEATIVGHGNQAIWENMFKEHPELTQKSEEELTAWYDDLSKDWTGYGASNIVRARMK